MIFKTGCKINLGLKVLSKRGDGFHNISTIFYPINGLYDLIEIVPSETDCFTSSGIVIDCPLEKNLCIKALTNMRSKYDFPNCHIHLHKSIPFGAGLGGGSANAMGVIEGINTLFSLGMSTDDKIFVGTKIGSDVPFFAKKTPQLASGRGEILSDISVSLNGIYLQIAKPDESVSTKEAYEGVIPNDKGERIEDIIKMPIKNWAKILKNDFEPSVMGKLDKVRNLKKYFYDNGAVYSSMSGSGSSVFGLFTEKPSSKPEYLILEQQIID